jgi:sterol 3beta-glucosyltransferase
MHILILCNDTRGGVQPYAALAQGLVAAGHTVSAVAPIGLTHLFGPRVTITPLAGTEDALAFATGGGAEKGTGAAMRLMARELPRRLAAWCQTVLAAADGADVMTGGIGGMAIGRAVAEKLHLPFIPTHLQPVAHPTSAYPGVLFPGTPKWTGPLGRWVSHYLSDAALWMPFRAAMADVRRDTFGLTGRPRVIAGVPAVYGFSRHVVPMADGPLRHVTGYWHLPAPQTWQPPAALDAFINGGTPVISFGFGSMGAASPRPLAEMVAAAADAAGVRAVMQADWQSTTPTPTATLYAASDIPHGWLFPRMAANVHHGGAGTTAAALAAGRPSVVVPFAVDQPFWGARVQQLGAGPAPIPRRSLDQPSLTRALQQVVADAAMQVKARTLAETLALEDGVAQAVAVFNQFAEMQRTGPDWSGRRESNPRL